MIRSRNAIEVTTSCWICRSFSICWFRTAVFFADAPAIIFAENLEATYELEVQERPKGYINSKNPRFNEDAKYIELLSFTSLKPWQQP
jgi:hypothetical protein